MFLILMIASYDAYFVDLFVRTSNNVAIQMYEKFGYIIYRRVLEYYVGPNPEDAYDMRKALPRDLHRKSVIPRHRAIHVNDLEYG
jgi:N-terminal acetyltransferase B complex catalytic subunit